MRRAGYSEFRPRIFFFSCFLLGAGALSAGEQPFAPDDFDAVYSDAQVVRYQIPKPELYQKTFIINGEPTLVPFCDDDDTLPTNSCNTAIHRFCTGRGHLTGFGLESLADEDVVDVSCLTTNAASMQSVTRLDPGDPGASDPNYQRIETWCLDMAPPNLHCSVGIDRECGAAGGFGPVERSSNVVVFACLQDPAVEVLEPTSLEVTTGTSCQFPWGGHPVSDECGRAMSDYCEGQGYRGGYGPGEYLPPGSSGHPDGLVQLGCVKDLEDWAANATLPESPALPVDVVQAPVGVCTDPGTGETYPCHNAPSNHNLLAPFPSQSYNGRIYAGAKGDVITTDQTDDGVVTLGLHMPEVFDQPIGQDQSAGREQAFFTGYLNAQLNFQIAGADLQLLHSSSDNLKLASSIALCDAPLSGPTPHINQTQSLPDRVSNPRTCDAAGTLGVGDHDCYDVTLLTRFDNRDQGRDDLWATPVRVVVKHPKKSVFDVSWPKVEQVLIDHQWLGAPVEVGFGLNRPTRILEPVISGDGRLLIAQVDGHIQYSVLPAVGAACDASGWGTFKHISEMYDDPAMQNYGLAKFPMRDSENNVISTLNGDPANAIRGAYPWVDRDGDNLMFMAADQSLYYIDDNNAVQPRYAIEGHPNPDFDHLAVVPAVEQIGSFSTGTRIGLTFFGLWSQGKLMNPDTRNNNLDFGIFKKPEQYRMLDLYEDVVGGTEVGASSKVVVASPENQFQFLPNLLPETPREVVWHVASEGDTDEVAFDDINHPRALIVSEMAASMGVVTGTAGRYHDGFEWDFEYRDYDGDGTISPEELGRFRYQGRGFTHAAHVANSASAVSQELADFADSATAPPAGVLDAAVQWKVPSYGYLLGGARVEPLAAGGIRGKGLWLDGVDDRLEYLIDQQPDADAMETSPWLVTLSVNARAFDGNRRLITWPDGSYLESVGGTTLGLGWLGTPAPGVPLQVSLSGPLQFQPQKWTSLAVLSVPDCTLCAAPFPTKVSIFVDGMRVASMDVGSSNGFRLQKGLMVVGAESGGIGGWVDDFKVIGAEPTWEEVCNHAHGTLMGLDGLSSQTHPELFALAGSYAQSEHDALSSAIMSLNSGAATHTQYVCERASSAPTAPVCLGKTHGPMPADCLRPVLHQPEGALVWNQERPNTASNAFCLSCHVDSNPSGTMQPSQALISDPQMRIMHLDPRRQPMQNFPLMFGVVPEDYFGPDQPGCDQLDNASGYNIDRHTFGDELVTCP